MTGHLSSKITRSFLEFNPSLWSSGISSITLEPTLELEDACEKLLNGDPMTGKPYVYGGWVYRLLNPNGGVSATHDAEDDRDNSPDGYAETSSLHPDMNFTGIANLDESNDEVLLGDRSSINKPPSPPQVSKMEGATTSQCTPLHDLIWDKKGDSIEDAFLALEKRLRKAGVISEEVGQSLLEPQDQVSQLALLLDYAKLEINDRAEREKRLEEELMAERAKLEEDRARSALLEEEGKRKVAELEDALGQAEESAWAKEQSFPNDAADWAACHHMEVARSILTKPEETMDFFKVMYMELEGKTMITEIGSYGYQCGQKAERSPLYGKLKKRDATFDPEAMKHPALYKEEPTPLSL
ncbi:unnamed protein product [Cuscuta campestris]|uniref:Uncharacterized protein n=1 Tax=Cuscuta campestris TaxID=132261 RepID=A0A484L0K4_9ASTE|nr:unnamed protein product [Cuscuta campestris]